MQTISDNRINLLNLIDTYKNKIEFIYLHQFIEQNNITNKFTQFIHNNPECFFRSNLNGHITGSALVVNNTFSKVLFTYHAKLHRWLQLGGHADGEHIIQNVALKEACEESGLDNFRFVDILNFPHLTSNEFEHILPFDLDVHIIPERKLEPEHEHYDVRFILVAQKEEFKISEESLDLKWIDLNEVEHYSSEKSTLRQIAKLKFLKNKFNLDFAD